MMPNWDFDQDRVLWDADYRRRVIDRLNRQSPPSSDRTDDDPASDVFALAMGMPLPSGDAFPSKRRMPESERAFVPEA